MCIFIFLCNKINRQTCWSILNALNSTNCWPTNLTFQDCCRSNQHGVHTDPTCWTTVFVSIVGQHVEPVILWRGTFLWAFVSQVKRWINTFYLFILDIAKLRSYDGRYTSHQLRNPDGIILVYYVYTNTFETLINQNKWKDIFCVYQY